MRWWGQIFFLVAMGPRPSNVIAATNLRTTTTTSATAAVLVVSYSGDLMGRLSYGNCERRRFRCPVGPPYTAWGVRKPALRRSKATMELESKGCTQGYSCMRFTLSGAVIRRHQILIG
jgi:hypothetical protein